MKHFHQGSFVLIGLLFQFGLRLTVMVDDSNSFTQLLCQNGWLGSPYSKTCLFFNPDSMTRPDQISKCQQIQARLVDVGDCLQQNFIQEYAMKELRLDKISIGVKQNKRGGKFVREKDTKEIRYNDFKTKPGDLGEAACVVLSRVPESRWEAVTCGQRYPSVCEMDADRMCEAGLYGENCSKTCSKFCFKHTQGCNLNTGACMNGCVPGRHGPTCEEECDVGFFGRNCDHACSQHCSGGTLNCDKKTGKCLRGCKQGLKGSLCNQGIKEKKTGKCLRGCKQGLKGSLCNQVCTSGSYGADCKKNCSSHCAGTYNACDEAIGRCIRGCKVGYEGDRCDEVIYHLYGVSLQKVALISAMFLLIWMGMVSCIIGAQGHHEKQNMDHEEDWQKPSSVRGKHSSDSGGGKSPEEDRRSRKSNRSNRSNRSSASGGRGAVLADVASVGNDYSLVRTRSKSEQTSRSSGEQGD